MTSETISRPSRPVTHRLAWLATATAALLLLAPTGVAQGEEDPDPDGDGWITIHDSMEGEATDLVTCEFWVRGHDFTEQEGRLSAAHWLGGPSAHGHEFGTFNGTPDGEGTFDFFVGPFTLHETDDQYLVVALVEPEGEQFEQSVDGQDLAYISCEDEGKEDPFAPFKCPNDLTGTANGDGSIELSWAGTDEADFYVVMRKEAGQEDFMEYAQTDEPGFVDTDTEVGTTYDYHVAAREETIHGDGTYKSGCGATQVTSIPFFGALGGVTASIVGLGAYALVRRRR